MSKLIKMVLLTAMCAVGGVWAQTATHTWGGSGSSVTGLTNGSVVEIRSGAWGTLTVPTGVEISIISNGEVRTNGITLNINANARVVWTADLIADTHTTATIMTVNGTGNLSIEGGYVVTYSFDSVIGGAIVSNLTGAGTISVTGGGVWAARIAIRNNATGTVTVSGNAVISSESPGATGTIHNNAGGTINIAGGTVINFSSGHAIWNESSGIITVSGGEVLAITGRAIHNQATGTVTVRGNAVISSESVTNTTGTIHNNAGGTINIEGGTVRNYATNATAHAVYNMGAGIITVSGGEVSAILGRAIHRNAGTVNITGGLVIAQNTATSGVVNAFNTHSGGVIIGYTPGARQIDGTDGLVSLPTNANKRWGVNNGIPGIFYGENHNLFSVTVGVNIGNLFSWNSTAPNLGSNTTATVTISQGASGTLNVPEGAEISIISNGAVDNTSAITLNIGADAKVVWTADLTLNTTATTMTVNGTGNLSIEGGQVRSNASGNAIRSNLTGAGTITVSGGEISAIVDAAIDNRANGIITVSDNAVITSASIANTTGTIHNQAGGTINIEGGAVRNTAANANARAIYNNGTGLVIVSGGVVSVSGAAGRAIHNQAAGGTIIAKDGTISVTAGGTEIHNQVATGVIIRYNTDAPRVSGTTDGLTVTGTGATAMWRLNSSAQGGILYRTDRFFVVPDVIVNKAEIAIPELAELTYNGTAQSPSLSVPNSAYSVIGNAETNTGNYQATVSFSDTDNYKWEDGDSEPIQLSWEIKPAPLTISGVTATNRAYNSETTVALTGGELVGVIADDNAGLTLGNGTIADANVGDNKDVTTNITLGNANYVLSAQPTNVTVNITPAPLTITGVSATNRIYNSETTVTLTGGELVGVIFGDDEVNFNRGNGTMSDKNVGDNKAVATAITLTGAAAGNYALTQPNNVTVTISPLQLTIAAPNVTATRAYNGGVTAAATAGALENKFGEDDVIVTATATYNSKNVLEANEITVVYEISGADAGNYIVPENFAIAGTIIKAVIEFELPTSSAITYGQTVGTSTLSGGMEGGTWAWYAGVEAEIPNAGNTPFTVVFTPTDNDNYDWATIKADQNFDVALTVNPIALTITGVSATNRTYNGEVTVALTGGELVGIIDGDVVSFTLGNGTMANKNADEDKAVTTAITLTGAAAGNYTLTQPIGITVNIAKADPIPAITPSTATATSDQTLADITTQLPDGWTWKEAGTTSVGEVGQRTHVAVFIPEDQDNFNTLEANVTITVAQGPTSIRNNNTRDNRYGIVLENAIVSDVARISVITPEPAAVNMVILDNLGNVVFSADDVRAGFKPAPTADGAIVWNLQNFNGRFVANGTYLIVVETTCISGRRFQYSTRIGVNR